MIKDPNKNNSKNRYKNTFCNSKERNLESWIMYFIGAVGGWACCWMWYFG